MKLKLLITIFLAPFIAFAQEGVTVKIETLTKPEKLLSESSTPEIFQKLILSDVGASSTDETFQSGIIAQSNTKEPLVDYGYHAFFNGMYAAYADHRPFVLSPDMIWLLVSQGFAHHVNNNAEKLRPLFVDFSGNRSLMVQRLGKIKPDEWETVFPEFTEQISKYVGNELIDALSCNFSTTTATSKIASEITTMKSMESYFKFRVGQIICGIPEVRLEGTTQDWEKVLEKAQYLKKYQLDWWIDELEPILKKFVETSQKKIDKDFWRNMFIVHPAGKGCGGEPEKVNGWVVKFFPYDKEGQRFGLKEIWINDKLPKEIVKVDLELVTDYGGGRKTEQLELWAGFIGLKQTAKTYALKPQIAWMIRKTDKDNDNLGKAIKADHHNYAEWPSKFEISVRTIPKELLDVKKIDDLTIHFSDEIVIPDEMANMAIRQLHLTGKISEQGIERIRKILPDAGLYINGERYNIGVTSFKISDPKK
jgi:hypothetical protein